MAQHDRGALHAGSLHFPSATALTATATAAEPTPASSTAPARAGATGEDGSLPPAIRRSVVGGTSSDAHCAPQRQHVSFWPAIGASQVRQRRGMCRLRMASEARSRERTRRVAVSVGSIEGGSSVADAETARQVAGELVARPVRCAKSLAKAVKWPRAITLLPCEPRSENRGGARASRSLPSPPGRTRPGLYWARTTKTRPDKSTAALLSARISASAPAASPADRIASA